MGFSPASVPEGFQRASGKPFGAPVGAYPFPRRGLTRRLRRGRWVCRPEEGSTFFRRERKYQRKHAARRLQRRPAPLRVIRKYRRSGHCRARLLYLLRPASRQLPTAVVPTGHALPLGPSFGLREPFGLSSSTGCPVSHSSLPVALLASHPPCGSLWATPKAPLGPRFPSGQFAALTRREKGSYCPF